MNQLANYLGKVALLIFMCVGLVVSSTTAASANTKPGTNRTSAKTVKTNSTDKTKKPKRRSIKKKRRHTRRSPANSTSKSTGKH